MKPLAKLIDKIEKRSLDKFYKKSENMSIYEVNDRLFKLISKELIRHYNDRHKYILEFEVASKTVYDEFNMTLLEYMKGQYKDEMLRHWAYKVDETLEANKHLTDLLVAKYSKDVCIKKYKNDIYEEYYWKRPKDYQYTLKISLR